MGIKILGCGMYVPQIKAENEDFTKFVETSDEWITTRTGIKTRHIASGELTYQMGAKAAKQAVENAGIPLDEIDMVIATTVTPDTLTPSMACLIAKEIGIESATSFDLNAACTAYVFALDVAHKYLACGDCRNVLIVSAEMVTRMVDYTDRSTCVLFGDGAAATVVTASDALYASYIGTAPQGATKIYTKLPQADNPFKKEDGSWGDEEIEAAPDLMMQMAGNDVYKFATTIMPEAVEKAAEKAGIAPSDLDLIIPHQANIRIVQTAIKRMHLADDKFYINIQDFGNISSACIPLALSQLSESGKMKRGDKICLVGFGAGLTYGAAIFEY